MTQDTAAANRELGRKFSGDQDRLPGGPAEERGAPECRGTLGGNPPMPRAGHEGFAKGFYAAFPEMNHTIEEVFATEDRVLVRFVLRGVNSGSFFGMPATHRQVDIAAHVIMHVAGGKVTKLFGIFDEAGLLRQLGILPTN